MLLCGRIAFVLAGALLAISSARAAPPPIEAYGQLPGIEQIHLSPSGQRYAFVGAAGDARKLFVATTDNKPLLIVPLGESKVIGVEWAGESHLLVRTAATINLGMDFDFKNELETVNAINVDAHKNFAVFSRRATVADAVFGYYGAAEVDGRWYGYFGGITFARGSDGAPVYDHGYPDLYRVDLDNGDIHMAAAGSELSDGWLVGPHGEVIAHSTYNQKNGEWTLRAGDRGGKLLGSGLSTLGGVRLLSLGRTSDTMLIWRPTEEDKAGVYEELSIVGASTPPVPAGRFGVLSDPKTGLWIGYTRDADEPVSTLFSPMLEARLRGTRKAFPGERVALVDWNAAFDRLIVKTEGDKDSGTYWMVDIAKGSADPLGGDYQVVGPADVGSVRVVDFKAADGLAMHGVLTLPHGREAKGLPVVVLPHGGPEARDYPGFNWWAQAFASRGYAVFQPNFRGSSGYGAEFRNAGFNQMGRKMQTDISDGVAELARQGIIDPKRACIVGASYGGYAALAGVTLQQGLYRCAVSYAGMSDLVTTRQYDARREGEVSDVSRYWDSYYGAKIEGYSVLAKISPVEFAARADAPILLIHGVDDTNVPIDQSREMEAALKRAGKPVEFVQLTGEDHNLSHEATRVAMLKAVVAFVEKHNPPDPPK
jgi:dipeptidyl aminopeptidase/acylaminoacyl peptidase